jgi:hypothetical protein
LIDDVGAVDRRMRAVVPLDGGRNEPFLGRPHVVGNCGDSIVDPDNLASPYWTSTHFKRQNDATGWHPAPCSAR